MENKIEIKPTTSLQELTEIFKNNDNEDTINEALNHASRDKVTDIYIARDWRRVWDANRNVLNAVFK